MMLRDRDARTRDMRLLTKYREPGKGRNGKEEHPRGQNREDICSEIFDPETVRRYRTYLEDRHHGYDWDTVTDDTVLSFIGACGDGEDGVRYPAAEKLLSEMEKEGVLTACDGMEKTWSLKI